MCCVMLKLTMEQDPPPLNFSSIGEKFKTYLVQGVASYDIKLGTNEKIMGRQSLCYFLPNRMMHSALNHLR